MSPKAITDLSFSAAIVLAVANVCRAECQSEWPSQLTLLCPCRVVGLVLVGLDEARRDSRLGGPVMGIRFHGGGRESVLRGAHPGARSLSLWTGREACSFSERRELFAWAWLRQHSDESSCLVINCERFRSLSDTISFYSRPVSSSTAMSPRSASPLCREKRERDGRNIFFFFSRMRASIEKL
jgi:hypothetical protein